ncbi:MAG TPA: O-antigen ligase family protein [Flavobacterium sp.]|nr:O-antigen ligase family protein [Flavobacterium sp.]
MKHIDKIYNYLFVLLCFIIPISGLAKAVPNILIIALVVLFPFHSLRNSIKSIKKELLFLLAFILIIALNTLLFQRFEDMSIISRLVFIPLFIALAIPVKNFKACLSSFVIGSFFILLMSSIQIGLISLESKVELVNGAKIAEFLMGERPYLGFIYLISVCFSVYLGVNSNHKYLRTLYIGLAVLFAAFIFIMAARIAALSVVLGLALSLFYFLRKIKNKAMLLIGISVFGLLMYGLSGNMIKRFYVGNEYVNVITADPRYYIWGCATQMSVENTSDLLFGKGYYGVEDELVLCYTTKVDFLDAEQQQWFIDSRFNTHNQFFDIFLSQGILATLLFCFFFLYLAFISRKNFFMLSLVLFLFLFFMVENVLTRQLGCMLVGFVLCFILRQQANRKKIESAQKPVKLML